MTSLTSRLPAAFAHLPRPTLADSVAIGIAISLPWSTSATSTLIVVWLIAVLPRLHGGRMLAVLKTPAGALPLLLWGFAALGMAWSPTPWVDSMMAMRSFHKLLLIPILLAYFSTSAHGATVLCAFFLSCVALLATSAAMLLWPGLLPDATGMPGVPVKEYVAQSTEFALCAFVLFFASALVCGHRRVAAAIAMVGLGLLFLLNIGYVATARSTLLVLPALLLLLIVRRLGPKIGIAITAAAVGLVALVWTTSPYMRARLEQVVQNVQRFQIGDADSSVGVRLKYWERSIELVREAPIIGHGTGSIREMLRDPKVSFGTARAANDNPHNQTLAVALQLGLLGTLLLYGMWGVHLLLFRGRMLVAEIGAVVVVQNAVASLFHSHLFDFTPGWIYVMGVGILGGMVLQARGQFGDVRPDGPLVQNQT